MYSPNQLVNFNDAAVLAKENVPLPNGAFSQSDLQDPAWTYATIDEVRWNLQFPYQLVILQKKGNQFLPYQNLAFTLPIPPEELQTSMPFAINTIVTAGGIVEEHNGAPLRPINFAGTTGLLPLRGSGTPVTPRTLGQSIFAGTLRGINGLTQNITAATQGNQALFKTNLVNPNEISAGPLAQSTGYYQFLVLERFLEQYITLKKSKAGSQFVLGLAVFKEQAIYLVTPREFSRIRSKAEPLMWNYRFSLMSWGRTIPQKGLVVQPKFASPYQNKDLLTTVLNRLSSARRAAESLSATIEGFSADVNHTLFEPLRQTTLFLKDLLGATVTAADLPATITQSMKNAILTVAGLNAGVTGLRNAIFGLDRTIQANLQIARQSIQNFSTQTGVSSTLNGTSPGAQQVINSSASPANKILSNPGDNFDLFNTIIPGQLNLSPTVQAQITNEKNTVKKLTRQDFANFRDQILELSANYADAVGAGSIQYDELYGRSIDVVSSTTRTPTAQEFDALNVMNESILQLNYLAATAVPSVTTPNVMQYVAALANPEGIAFNIPNSKFAVPFPYGSTLEMVASRYLGDPDRWIEIATLNNLSAPYVDESGFTRNLVTVGNGNQVEISDATNLYVGQSVYLQSNTFLRTIRNIQSITQIGVSFVIVVDGEPNLGGLSPIDAAQLAAFLPNTVNSQRIIFIPSDKPPPTSDFEGPPNEIFANLQNQLAVGGADLLLTGNGDLAIDQQGNAKLAVGMTNLVQKVKLAIDTLRGTLLHHPDYGFPQIVGQSTADLSAQQILVAAKDLLQNDPSFTGVQNVMVNKTGPLVQVSLDVGVVGTSNLLPIMVELNPVA